MTGMLGQEERPQRADARRNRERILESARVVFARSGADAQIDDVARQANVGVGTVYRHFPTKEALLSELVREKFRLLTEGARRALDRPGDPFDSLAEWMRESASQLERDATMQQALAGAGEQIWLEATAEHDELMEVSEQLLERGRAAGTIRSDATPPDIGMLMCGLSATIGHPAPLFDWHRHLELLVDTLRPRQTD
jgi:AcrR family transcriptional regulator